MILSEQIISQLIQNEWIGSDPLATGAPGEWPIYVGRMPTTPDDCIAVQRDSLPTEGRTRLGTEGHEGLQIRVRHTQYEPAQKKMLEIAKFFDTVYRQIVAYDGRQFRIQCIVQPNRPIFIGPDPNTRCNFVLNCVTSIQEV